MHTQQLVLFKQLNKTAATAALQHIAPMQIWRHHKLHDVPSAKVQPVAALHCHLLEFPAAAPPQHSTVRRMASARSGRP